MLTIVIQSGGESRRMGTDKGLVPFLGKPLIQRVYDRVAHLATEILVTTNKPEDYSFLNIRMVPDLLPGSGALGGLYTALSTARYPLVAVVACDMPFVNADLLAALKERLVAKQCDAAVPRSQGGLEPFHSVYRRDSCLPLIQAALEADKRRVDSWFAQANILFFSQEEALQYDPNQVAFLNVNTPEELRQAELLAQQSGW